MTSAASDLRNSLPQLSPSLSMPNLLECQNLRSGPGSHTVSHDAEQAADKRLPESQETAHTSAPQHYCLLKLNGGIRYVELGILLNRGTGCSIQLC